LLVNGYKKREENQRAFVRKFCVLYSFYIILIYIVLIEMLIKKKQKRRHNKKARKILFGNNEKWEFLIY
jgi:hypothetical protein